MAIVNSTGMAGRNPGGVPVPDPAPDYAATIRAPTPTPGTSGGTESREAPVIPQDVLKFTEYMAATAQHDAVAIAAGTNPVKLVNLIVSSPGTDQCYRELARTVKNMPGQGKMGLSTATESLAASRCLAAAAAALPEGHYRDTGQEERERRVATFLKNYAVASNPTTELAIREPSPRNMKFWRTSWQWHEPCYPQAAELAGPIAAETDPTQAVRMLANAASRVQDCMASSHRTLQEAVGETG